MCSIGLFSYFYIPFKVTKEMLGAWFCIICSWATQSTEGTSEGICTANFSESILRTGGSGWELSSSHPRKISAPEPVSFAVFHLLSHRPVPSKREVGGGGGQGEAWPPPLLL